MSADVVIGATGSVPPALFESSASTVSEPSFVSPSDGTVLSRRAGDVIATARDGDSVFYDETIGGFRALNPSDKEMVAETRDGSIGIERNSNKIAVAPDNTVRLMHAGAAPEELGRVGDPQTQATISHLIGAKALGDLISMVQARSGGRHGLDGLPFLKHSFSPKTLDLIAHRGALTIAIAPSTYFQSIENTSLQTLNLGSTAVHDPRIDTRTVRIPLKVPTHSSSSQN